MPQPHLSAPSTTFLPITVSTIALSIGDIRQSRSEPTKQRSVCQVSSVRRWSRGLAGLLFVPVIGVIVATIGCENRSRDAWSQTAPPVGAPMVGANSSGGLTSSAEERIKLTESRMAALEGRLAALEGRLNLVVDLLQRRPASAPVGGSATPANAPSENAVENAATEGETSPSADALSALSGTAPAAMSPGSETTSTANGSAATQPEMTASDKVPAVDDRLLVYYADDPNSLNPLIANDNVSSAWIRYLYDPLARQNYANPDEWTPALAESWEFDKEKLTYTIHLRKGVMWHEITTPNGVKIPPKEFTANDVKFTFDCILNTFTEAASLRGYYTDSTAADELDRERIELTIIDDYTLTIRWKKPYFLMKEYTLGGNDMAIIPRHVFSVDADGRLISINHRSKEFGEAFNKHWANRKACGTGMMKLEKWAPNNGVDFVRNEQYFGKPFYFSGLRYEYISNPETAKIRGIKDELDFVAIPEKEQWLRLLDSPDAKDGKINPVKFQQMAYRYIGYNLDRPALADPAVRRALAHAAPVDEIIKNVFQGLATRVTGPMMPWTPFASPNVKPIPYDLDEARRILDEAGWNETNRDGVRIKTIDGEVTPLSIDLMIFSEAPSFRDSAILFQESCRKIGVQVDLAPTKWALMLESMKKKTFDAVLLGWVSDYKTDPQQLWHSSQADVPEGDNWGYRSKDVDAAIEELQTHARRRQADRALS